MGATEHAPRDPLRVLERIYGLAEMVERGGGVLRVTYGIVYWLLYWLLKMANAQHEIVAKIARLPRRVVAPNCAHETRADF